jgi:hypothetical protein
MAIVADASGVNARFTVITNTFGPCRYAAIATANSRDPGIRFIIP